MPIVTALYAGILGLIAVGEAFPAGMLRGKLNISVGDGGNPALLELNGVSVRAIHALGAALVMARLLHAAGLKSDTVQNVGRAIGAMTTAPVTAIASIWLLVVFVHR